jgi:hypothetical protein
MIKKICENCQKEFLVKTARRNTARFCSHKCYSVSIIGITRSIIVKKCIGCGKEYSIMAHLKNRKYCSITCASKYRKRREKTILVCKQCGREFSKGHKKMKFCSKNCADKNRIGGKPCHWKGGRIKNTQGYILIYSPNHPRKDSRGYVREHILIMEKMIGRYLQGKEMIHHINGVKSDNSPDNLYLCQNSAEHMRLHSKN